MNRNLHPSSENSDHSQTKKLRVKENISGAEKGQPLL
jgi:hypothetical protein